MTVAKLKRYIQDNELNDDSKIVVFDERDQDNRKILEINYFMSHNNNLIIYIKNQEGEE